MGAFVWFVFLFSHFVGVLATTNVSFPCHHKLVRVGRTENDGGLLMDPQNKILLSWTPKAACTVAVSMLFHHMGVVYGRDYHEFPHTLRPSFYEQCGFATAAMLTDPTWLRIKVVRNPFDRAVSSYFHAFRHTVGVPATKIHFPNYDNISFADFIDTLLNKPPGFMYRSDNGSSHWYFQHRIYEVEAAEKHEPSPFNVILHAEHIDEDLVKLNRLVKSGHHGKEFPVASVHLDFNNGNHYETVNVSKFLGRMQWWQVKDLHPANYSVMYDDVIRAKTAKLFHWDLVLYSYTWPY